MNDKLDYDFVRNFYELQQPFRLGCLMDFDLYFADSYQWVNYVINHHLFNEIRAHVFKFHVRNFIEKTLQTDPKIQFLEFTQALVHSINEFSEKSYRGYLESHKSDVAQELINLNVFAGPDLLESVTVATLPEKVLVGAAVWESMRKSAPDKSPYILELRITSKSSLVPIQHKETRCSDYEDRIIQENTSISEWLKLQRKDSTLRNFYNWLMKL